MMTDPQLIAFIYQEARLIDEQKFEDWLDLYDDDAWYWMPLTHGQPDARLHTSLMHENKLLLRVRVERLAGQRTFSQQPKSRCHHLLQTPFVEHGHAEHQPAEGRYVTRTAFHYVETRNDEQTLYAGWATHHLVETGGALKIRFKQVDLVNCEAAFGNIQLLM
ncbi:MAG TPA: aromatic-ring-hydroxylating dioxygenase subunit beta [Bordetella sp.]